MKITRALITIATTACLICALGYAEKAKAQEGNEISVKLTNPDKPCQVECSLINGSITVAGYNQKEVTVQARSRETEEWVDWDEDERKDEEWAEQGLKKIPVSSSSFEVEEDDNHVTVEVPSWSRTIDVIIKVPIMTSLKLTCINAGDIEVSNVNGEIEAKNINGSIVLNGVSGSVLAYVQNGKMEAELKKVTKGKAMSFASFNGNVDVTLPADVRTTVKVSTHTGDAYSDFDITAIDRPIEVIEDNDDLVEGKYRVRIQDAFYGNINGGGPEFDFSTFNGDIFIRKAK